MPGKHKVKLIMRDCCFPFLLYNSPSGISERRNFLPEMFHRFKSVRVGFGLQVRTAGRRKRRLCCNGRRCSQAPTWHVEPSPQRLQPGDWMTLTADLCYCKHAEHWNRFGVKTLLYRGRAVVFVYIIAGLSGEDGYFYGVVCLVRCLLREQQRRSCAAADVRRTTIVGTGTGRGGCRMCVGVYEGKAAL